MRKHGYDIQGKKVCGHLECLLIAKSTNLHVKKTILKNIYFDFFIYSKLFNIIQ